MKGAGSPWRINTGMYQSKQFLKDRVCAHRRKYVATRRANLERAQSMFNTEVKS